MLRIALVLLFFCCGVAAQEWKLVWTDEFDKPGAPDAAKWGFESGFVRNQEEQWYQPENARVVDGMLVIEARRERRANPEYVAGSREWRRQREFAEYTSSSLVTRGKHEWQYGRFEMRGKIDVRAGIWPAFWSLGVSGRWPANGEVDIMEYYRGMLLFNVAWEGADRGRPVWSTVRKKLAELPADWADRFHVWRMDWDAESISLYLDDVLMNKTDIRGKAAFHQPQYLLLNVAVGGQNGGDPSATPFPSRFLVDYVRVYQRAGRN